ncbi:PDZ domain-containing protein [Pseudalkalibacillus caeni]|uniref:PDZ domain-containing protein n=1 Tax=Exobacillus caeni TaxID=2574798 RepID=A0A5R9FA46_9BACL|nr:PDZ domain-containing protein [Pseudalkalibacillus caeni]TLS38518.1 PDZ domain-containing protein [Pseudalkalibacillus caeni]
MAELLLTSLLKGIVSFLINPLFYLIIIAAFWLGIQRVKRERLDFHTRVYGVLDDVFITMTAGLGIGLVLSAFSVALGITLPFGTIVLLSLCTILLLAIQQIRFLSPAFIFILPIVAAIFLQPFNTGIELLDKWVADLPETSISGLIILLGFLIIAEGFLVWTNGKVKTSPKLIHSKRGKVVGAHEVRRVWLLPFFLLLPVGNLTATDWWPLLSFGNETFAFIAVPFGIGFQKLVHHTLPAEAMRLNGLHLVVLGVIVFGTSLAGHLTGMQWLAVTAAIVAIVGRLAILIYHRGMNKPAYFKEQNEGLVILGIIPGSPASKMNLKVGEVVQKVNGQLLHEESDFYQGLQRNAAFCKLEVLDYNGEVRFEQRALYHNEHHELGLLFVHARKHKRASGQ